MFWASASNFHFTRIPAGEKLPKGPPQCHRRGRRVSVAVSLTGNTTDTIALQETYNQYQQTITEAQNKVQELRMDVEEHKVVRETLAKTDPARKTYRMVGGALVEETAGFTAGVLETRLANINAAIQQLTKELVRLTQEFDKWKTDKQIKVIKE